MIAPYFSDGQVTLYLGDCREIVPELGITADLVLTDPPYGETSLEWDRWPDGWPAVAATAAASMWCFGSMRMFLAHGGELHAAGWLLSQDVVWEKPVGTSLVTDRFRRVHEFALHWYRGRWDAVHHNPPKDTWHGPDRGSRFGGSSKGPHLGEHGSRGYIDDGTRLARSVIRMANLHGRSIHPTEKPVGLLDSLIRYGCPAGGGRARHVRGFWINA